ncbi:olfactory receptor 5V1-like [Hyperolius riggenbachi]|uniref:olfactory receptor 5V1-like n=1 Tax=Hyperolius riggenbachi TaxID=752182 RepID=UPI0035A32D21
MCENNQTVVTEFFVLGFKNIHSIRILVFSFFMLTYIVILIGNVLIIVLVTTCHHLHSPMYVFLKNLAYADILFTTNIMPNMLYVILMEGDYLSHVGCLIQYYVFCGSTYAQSLILSAMAFDRYLAICHPLRYATIMDYKLCRHLLSWPWVIGFLLILIEMVSLFQLRFCGSSFIEHYFCDFIPILENASSDTSAVKTEDLLFSFLLVFVPFVFVVLSYFFIFISILKINSMSGRWKAFSTCSAHLATLFIFYGTQITIYMFPVGGNSYSENMLKSLLYTVFTPFINPILYSMRNTEIRKATQFLFSRKGKQTYPFKA